MVTTSVQDRAEPGRRSPIKRIVVLLVILLGLVSGVPDLRSSTEARTLNQWFLSIFNPVIGNRRFPFWFSTNLPVAIWNDPSVLKEGRVYSMWASVGSEALGVSIYKLISLDGRIWAVANKGKPVLTPGNQANGDPDWFGVETPAVIKVGDTYHMYYSFMKNGTLPFYSMAHATSPDGVNWTRHGELTSLTAMIGQPEGNTWGWLGRAEPGVIYLNDAFYLYYMEAKCHVFDCSGAVPSVRGIALAVSTDGHHFVEVGTEPVLLQSASYPISQGWDGYSTPWPVLTPQGLELFVDVFRYDLTGRPALQESIAHYRSTDATHFTEVQAHVIRAGVQPWLAREVRAPSVIYDNSTGRYTMWFAGDNAREAPDNLDTLIIGIGIATRYGG